MSTILYLIALQARPVDAWIFCMSLHLRQICCMHFPHFTASEAGWMVQRAGRAVEPVGCDVGKRWLHDRAWNDAAPGVKLHLQWHVGRTF